MEPREEQALTRRLLKELAICRETNRRLNARCQIAEKAARDNVDACARKGISFGRALSHFAYTDLARRMREVIDPPNIGDDRHGPKTK